MDNSVYIESSVISYLTARPSRDVVTSTRQANTFEWWEDYKILYHTYISELVIGEISSGDELAAKRRLKTVKNIPLLETTTNALQLAKNLLEKKAVPKNSAEDALHISIASVQKMDFLLTWNFKHINNANTRRRRIDVIKENGFVCPILCLPEELINER